jgi:3-dehydroquinate synthetase
MDKELKLKIRYKPKTTTIHFGLNFALAKGLTSLLKKIEKRIAIITDHHLDKLYRSKIEQLGLSIFSIEPGETSKSRKTKEILENHLLSHNFGRDSLLIALGGGVIGDITGFLASTYCRGIPYFQIPTSLLAMVDSSIGGKTGVNTPYGKNMIGAFNPPEQVWIDVEFLKTLPERQWTIGIVEMIKASLIASPFLFNSLKIFYSQSGL